MYFLIVLLLLFETEFTCSMMRRRTQQVEEKGMVPLEIPYTSSVEKFIRDQVEIASHNISRIPLLISDLVNKIKGHQNYDKCDHIEPNPSQPGQFQPTQQSTEKCGRKCAKLNLQYIYSLQECISLAKEKMLENEASSYEVELIPIQKDIGTCVKIEQKVFLCDCTTNYQIRVSRSLKNAVENAVSRHNHPSITRDKKNDFFIFILLLKYHPRAAPVFFAYVVHRFRLGKVKTLEISEFDPDNSNLDTEISAAALPDGGLIDNRGSILINEDKIFEKLLQKINGGEVDFGKFGLMYLNRLMTIIPLFVIVMFIILILEMVGLREME